MSGLPYRRVVRVMEDADETDELSTGFSLAGTHGVALHSGAHPWRCDYCGTPTNDPDRPTCMYCGRDRDASEDQEP